MTATSTCNKRLVLPLAVAGAAGPFVFWALLLLAQSLHPGYNAWEDSISRLIFAPFGWLQTANFYFLAVFTAAFGAAVYLAVARSPLGRAAGVLLAIMGIAQLLTGLFGVDVNPSGQNSVAYVIHKMVFLVSAGSFPLGAFILVPDLWSQRQWRQIAFVTLAAAAAVLCLDLLWLVSQPVQPHLIDPWFGAYERTLVSISFAWMVVISARLLVLVSRNRNAVGRNLPRSRKPAR